MALTDTALRKRQQIAKANRTMFMWVAGVSVILGIATVASVFLVQKALFNERILIEKAKTASVLTKNNNTIDTLKDEVRVLNTDTALSDVMQEGQTQPVQVVLDALPSVANSSAFGASLQRKFLEDPDLTIESLVVDPVAGVEESALEDGSSSSSAVATENEEQNTIHFRFTVSTAASNASALKKLLQKLEKSIRPVNVTSLKVETQSNLLVMTAEGVSYYEPAKTIELKEKTIKP